MKLCWQGPMIVALKVWRLKIRERQHYRATLGLETRNPLDCPRKLIYIFFHSYRFVHVHEDLK